MPHPPLKSALIELEKIQRQFWKKSWGVLYILNMSKNAIYLAKKNGVTQITPIEKNAHYKKRLL